MILAIDFDGTCVEHRYPEIGKPVPGAIKWLKKFKEAGATLVLWTMRSTVTEDGDTLTPAMEYLAKHGVVMDYANNHPDQVWTDSRKLYASIYVDDAGFGCPLVTDGIDRPYVNWAKVGPAVLRKLEMAR